jgi:hypothetical protein
MSISSDTGQESSGRKKSSRQFIISRQFTIFRQFTIAKNKTSILSLMLAADSDPIQ